MALYFLPSQNVVSAVTATGTAPVAGYSLATLTLGTPGERVAWATGTATATFGTASTRVDYISIPNHNLSGSVLTVTNTNGLSEAITIPTAREDGFAKLLAIDLTALEPNATVRTASSWSLVITGNASPVVLSGGIALYSQSNSFLRNVAWGFRQAEGRNVIEHKNYYGNRLVYDLETVYRRLECLTLATDAQMGNIRTWFREMHGHIHPSLFWIDQTDPETAYFGTWQDELVIERRFTNVNAVNMVFTEWPTGIAI